MSNKWIVYEHKNKLNGKRYIGITSRPIEKRWGKNGNQYTEKKNKCFYNAIKKYGWDNFEHNILFNNLTEEEAKQKEKELIAKYHTCVFDKNKNGYNLTYGGEGTNGFKQSIETRIKMSENRKGSKNGFYGKTHSESQREKWSLERKNQNCGKENPFYGKHHNDGVKKKLSDLATKRIGELNPNYGKHTLAGENHPMYGKHHSDETKNKISESHKNIRTNEKEVYCLELDKTFCSAVEASKELHIDNSTICKCCKGKVKSIKGYHFTYPNKIKNNSEKPLDK